MSGGFLAFWDYKAVWRWAAFAVVDGVWQFGEIESGMGMFVRIGWAVYRFGMGDIQNFLITNYPSLGERSL